MNESSSQIESGRPVQYSSGPSLLTGFPRLIFFAIFGIAAIVILILLAALAIGAVVVALIIAIPLMILFLLIRIPLAILRVMLRPRVDDGRKNVRVIVRN